MSVSNLLIKYKNKLLTIPVLIILVLAVLITPAFTNAQEQGGSGLSISPTRTELSMLPGTSDVVTVSLKNITSGPIIAKIFVNDFEPDNETGEPKTVVDPEKRSASSISGFLSEVEDVPLESGESKDVSVNVTIPENAAPGGYYGALRFQAVPVGADTGSTQGSEVSLTANLLSLVLIEVPGDIEQKVIIDSVRAYLDTKAGSIFTKKPNFVGIRIENEGNSFVKPFGRVAVRNLQGNEVFSYELNDSNPRSNVLPNSGRTFKDRLMNVITQNVNGADTTVETSPITTPGRYTITADISYGNGGEVFTVKSNFWYLPVWFIVSVLAVVTALIVQGIYLYKKYATKSTKKRR